MENTTILFILIIVIIFLYLNSKSNKVEPFFLWGCQQLEDSGSCISNPDFMKKVCPNHCIRNKRSIYNILKWFSEYEVRLLKKRQDLINSGQDPNIINEDLQKIYKRVMEDLKQDFRVVNIDFDIKLDPNWKGELKSSLAPIVEQLQKMYNF